SQSGELWVKRLLWVKAALVRHGTVQQAHRTDRLPGRRTHRWNNGRCRMVLGTGSASLTMATIHTTQDRAAREPASRPGPRGADGEVDSRPHTVRKSAVPSCRHRLSTFRISTLAIR